MCDASKLGAWFYLSAAIVFMCFPLSASANESSALAPLAFVTRGPTTFGFVFRRGEIPATVRVMHDGKPVSAQVQPLVRWPDGSLKFARVTVVGRGQFSFEPTSTPALQTGEGGAVPDFSVRVVSDGHVYRLALKDMKAHVIENGPLLRLVSYRATPLIGEGGPANARLALRAWVWYYPTLKTAGIVASLENVWAQKADRNVPLSNLEFDLNGHAVERASGLTLWRWSGTRPVRIWTGERVRRNVVRNLAYLRSTGAVPYYDPTLKVSAQALGALQKRYAASPHGLMGHTLVTPYMPQTGGRIDIGPLPVWNAFAVLTNDPVAVRLSEDIADSSAVWPIHLRDEATGRPLSLIEYPMASTLPRAIVSHLKTNPIPCWLQNCRDMYPKTGSPLTPDPAHEPALNYVPYLLTADPFYYSELDFWNNWNALALNPGYRQKSKVEFLQGIEQIRAMAWQLRTLAYLDFVTPRNAYNKPFLTAVLANNLEVVKTKWMQHSDYPEPVVLVASNSPRGHGGMAPWEQDFLTWSFWNLVRLGYRQWEPVLKWNSGFVVHRLTDPHVCSSLASLYRVKIFNVVNKRDVPVGAWPAMVDATAKSKFYPLTLQDLSLPCHSEAFAKAMKIPKPGDFVGYPWSPQGFPSNMQPAVAAAADAVIPGGRRAWDVYAERPTKQDYSRYPNWAIVPMH